MTRSTTVRLPEPLLQRLHDEAAERHVPMTALAAELLDEGLKTRRFPGIEYRDGPAGRRASLKDGPDVWEVVRALRETPGQAEDALLLLAEQCELAPGLIRLAVEFYETYPGEIDARIAADEEAAQLIQEMIARREQLLQR
jgi:hypothetical protein